MALSALGRTVLDASSVDASLGAVVKYREDADRVRARGIETLVETATIAD
jgi:hypothetical protein